jgi:hypothetical protein
LGFSLRQAIEDDDPMGWNQLLFERSCSLFTWQEQRQVPPFFDSSFFPYYILLIINYVRAYRDAEVLKSVAKVNQLKELGMSYAPLTDLILLIFSYIMFRECPFASAMTGF